MALLVMMNKTKREVSGETATKLWNGLQDPSSLDDHQRAYLATVDKIYLNWRTAPDSYIKDNLEALIPFALVDWLVDKRGRITRPGSPAAWEFAKRWGLWEFHRPSVLVSRAAIIAEPALTGVLPVDYSEASSANVAPI